MIKINGTELKTDSFPDGTLLIKYDIINNINEETEIQWYYDNDRELISLIYITKHLNSHGIDRIRLFMPYIPNARQDRVKSNEDVFTLKYFSEIINSLNFTSVTVLDPHSYVSEALINNIIVKSPEQNIKKVIRDIEKNENEKPFLFYPDEGASKRYADMIKMPYAFGIKKRDWKTGNIKSLDIAGETEGIQNNNILIIDDICSKGGTFYFSAKKLNEYRAKNIYLYVSHCEKSILDGELIRSGLIKKIYTTDSICHFKNEIIEVMSCK